VNQLVNNTRDLKQKYVLLKQQLEDKVNEHLKRYHDFEIEIQQKRQEYEMMKQEIEKSKLIWPDSKSKKFDQKIQEIFGDEFEKMTSDNQDTCISSSPKAQKTYQIMIGELMNPAVDYRGFLLFHGIGSGKTCSTLSAILKRWEVFDNISSEE
jgi:hypothetical protein